MPHDITLSRLLRRLDEGVLGDVSRRWLPADAKRRATVAVEAAGLPPGGISPRFVKRANDREPGFTWRRGLTWTMALDVDRRPIVAQTARRGPTHDSPTLRPLVASAYQ